MLYGQDQDVRTQEDVKVFKYKDKPRQTVRTNSSFL